MGTWISHLRIAEQLLAVIPGLDEAAWSCGNLAPDSGIPNEDWSAFDPPKDVTHFLRKGEDEGRIKDLEFYRLYLAGVEPRTNPARFSFLLGYFTHLLSDNLWSLRAGRHFKRHYATLFAERGADAWWELKKDWYDLDHRYVRDHPDSLFWRVFLHAPNPPTDLPFLKEAALHSQLDYIRRFYGESNERVLDRVYPYINEQTMARYVDDAVMAVAQIVHLLQGGPVPADQPTAVAWLPPTSIAAYEPPLGDAEEDKPDV